MIKSELIYDVLYDNSNGSTGTITLSQDIKNYKGGKIFYNSSGRTNPYGVVCTDFIVINDEVYAILFLPIMTGGSVFYNSYSRIHMSGKQLTREVDWNIQYRPAPSITIIDTSSYIENKILKIVAYK